MEKTNISLNNILLVKENFNPERKCFKNEYECKNSYGYNVCVEEKYKIIACAKYSKTLCDDDTIFYNFFGKVRWLFKSCQIIKSWF